MWFRNLLIYRLTQTLDLTAEALAEAMATKPARKVASQEFSTYGFVAPFGKGEDAPLVHEASGYWLIAARKEERILPVSVVTDAVREKVEEIETDQMRKVYKKEKDQIKDEIVQAFLPRAFVRKTTIYAAFMPAQGLIIIDSASAKAAEDLLSTLREAIGTLPVRPVSVKIAPTATLTDWVRNQEAAEGLYILDECKLADTDEDGGSINAKRQDLTSDEMQLHVQAGKVVTHLSLAWSDKLSFVLDDRLVIRRLRFEDLLQDQAEKDGGDDALSQLDASFTLMMLTLAEFLPLLLDSLGGEELPEGIAANWGERPKREYPSAEDFKLAHTNETESGNISGDEEDSLYAEAKRFVLESRRASISAIQRKLMIGYNRAARLIETLEMNGVVTPMNSNGSREVIA